MNFVARLVMKENGSISHNVLELFLLIFNYKLNKKNAVMFKG